VKQVSSPLPFSPATPSTPGRITGVQVTQLLEELHLEQYITTMTEAGFGDVGSMLELGEDDLMAMGFKPGHRKRLLAAVRSYQTNNNTKTTSTTSIN
jgi:hypothetical protein